MDSDDVPNVQSQLHTVLDISGGVEPYPIPATGLSDTDLESLRRFVTYVADSVFPVRQTLIEVPPPYKAEEEERIEENNDDDDIGCGCDSDEDGWTCKREDGDLCDCVASFGNFYSISDNNDQPNQPLNLDALPDNWPLVECAPACSCADRCSNRVTQRGVRIPVTVRPVSQAGLGLFYTPLISIPLPRGTFISLYAGQYLFTCQARQRWLDQTKKALPGEGNYILSLRLPDQVVHIDPRRLGNVGRFLNHSCDPNCVIQVVRWGAGSWPRAAIFAKREISNGEELTFDYGNASGSSADADDMDERVGKAISELEGQGQRTKCYCGAERCRGWMPFDETL